MKTTFSGTFVKTINVENGEGFLEHILDVFYLHWFLRYLIKSLSHTFENRIVKLVKTLI